MHAIIVAYLSLTWLVCTIQSEDSLVGLLQGLADMDITFQALRVILMWLPLLFCLLFISCFSHVMFFNFCNL